MTYSSFGNNVLVRLGHAAEKIFVATNVCDTERHLRIAVRINCSRSEARTKLNLPGRFTVLYAGSMDANKRLDQLLIAAADLDPERYNFVLLGSGGLSDRLMREHNGFYGPMVDVGEKPVIWHVMNHFAHYGHKDFILCFDFDRNPIKDYFLKYETMSRDYEITLGDPNSLKFLSEQNEKDWQITFIYTGPNSKSGTMVNKVEKYLDCDSFLVTYGDRLTTMDLAKLIEYHNKSEKIGTTVAVRSPVRFRNYSRRHVALNEFTEKNGLREEFISGGIFVYNRKIFDLLFGLTDFCLEERLTARLIKDNEMSLYVYDGFWQQVDSQRDAAQLRNNLHVLG